MRNEKNKKKTLKLKGRDKSPRAYALDSVHMEALMLSYMNAGAHIGHSYETMAGGMRDFMGGQRDNHMILLPTVGCAQLLKACNRRQQVISKNGHVLIVATSRANSKLAKQIFGGYPSGQVSLITTR